MENNINIKQTKILSKDYYTLKKILYQYETEDGITRDVEREVYDRGNGVAILLYNKENQSVILTRQFRLPTYVNSNETGMMIEVCAGMLEEDNPDDCVKREVEEETGYRIDKVKKVFTSYMSPGAVTEIIHFYVGNYNDQMKVSEGGGLETEGENIEVMELKFDKAYDMIYTGEIKDSKTIMLLQYAKINELL
jgi:nudix-type nucleoside diphosphatase (YffH/AdpP family)